LAHFAATSRPPTTPLGLAIVGAGRMGMTHLRALAGEPSVRVTAIVEPSDAARARAAEAAPDAGVFADLPAAVAAGGVEAVLIAAPSTLHLGLVEAVVGLGLPVLCEKPCGTTSSEVRAAAEAARRAGCLLQVGYWRRFVPELQALRTRIASGALGELTLVACYQWDAGPPAPGFRGTSGGIAVDMGVHELDQLRWLTGQELGRFAAAAQPPRGDGPEGLQLLGPVSRTATASGSRSSAPAGTSASPCSGEPRATRRSQALCAPRWRRSPGACAARTTATARARMTRSRRSPRRSASQWITLKSRVRLEAPSHPLAATLAASA
jgi:predicted dehydrogenase